MTINEGSWIKLEIKERHKTLIANFSYVNDIIINKYTLSNIGIEVYFL